MTMTETKGSLPYAVAARFHMTTKNAAAQTVDALQRKGLIRTAVHPHDQRAKLLELTPEGFRTLQDDPRNALITALQKLPEADLHHLARLTGLLAHDLFILDEVRKRRPDNEAEEADGEHIGCR